MTSAVRVVADSMKTRQTKLPAVEGSQTSPIPISSELDVQRFPKYSIVISIIFKTQKNINLRGPELL